MDLSHQNTYWNKVAPVREFTTPLDLELIESHIGKTATILDYGCGYGRSLDQLYHRGYVNLTGYDISAGMIKRGRAQFPYLDLNVMGKDGTGHPGQSVDLLLLFAVLTCIVEDSALESTILEIRQLLKPGGYLLINDFLLNEDERNINRYLQFQSKFGKYGIFELPDGGILRHFAEDRIFELFGDFELVNYDKTVFTTMNGNPGHGFNLLVRKV